MLMSDIKPQIQEAQRINQNKLKRNKQTAPRHIIFKLQENQK